MSALGWSAARHRRRRPTSGCLMDGHRGAAWDCSRAMPRSTATIRRGRDDCCSSRRRLLPAAADLTVVKALLASSPARFDAALRRLLPTRRSLPAASSAAVALSASTPGLSRHTVRRAARSSPLFAALDERPALSSTASAMPAAHQMAAARSCCRSFCRSGSSRRGNASAGHVALAASQPSRSAAQYAWGGSGRRSALAFGQAFRARTWSADASQLAVAAAGGGRTVAPASDGRAGPCRLGPAPPVCRRLYLPLVVRAWSRREFGRGRARLMGWRASRPTSWLAPSVHENHLFAGHGAGVRAVGARSVDVMAAIGIALFANFKPCRSSTGSPVTRALLLLARPLSRC